jgi:hypothetical protein
MLKQNLLTDNMNGNCYESEQKRNGNCNESGQRRNDNWLIGPSITKGKKGMRDSIDNLNIEKRKLAVTMVDYAIKKNKTAVDMLVQQQIDEINQEIKK